MLEPKLRHDHSQPAKMTSASLSKFRDSTMLSDESNPVLLRGPRKGHQQSTCDLQSSKSLNMSLFIRVLMSVARFSYVL